MAGLLHVLPPTASSVPVNAAYLEHLLRFAPLRTLDDEALAELLPLARLESYSDQKCLFQLSDNDNCEYFLLSGELKLVAADGRVHRVAADSPVAQQPLARLRPRHYSAVVELSATLLVVDRDLLARLQEHMQRRVQLRYGVEELESSELAPESEELLLFRAFKDDFRHFHVHLADLPLAVAEMRRMIRLGSNDSTELARVAVSMPSLERFLVHAANSPLLSPREPCHHCITAIERMGPNVLADLLLVFAVYWLRAKDSADAESVWQFTLGVSAYGWWLAERTGLVEPMQALVLGVLHNMGRFVALQYMNTAVKSGMDALDTKGYRILSSLFCRDVTLLQCELWNIDEKYSWSLPVMYDWQKSGKMLRPDLSDV
ncbi:MAG TPA: HDOD domain-containing protein, partial [Pseudomonadales bacterium]|nr:HDOD domain-containing protein [Pseudomonadales bacterium]